MNQSSKLSLEERIARINEIMTRARERQKAAFLLSEAWAVLEKQADHPPSPNPTLDERIERINGIYARARARRIIASGCPALEAKDVPPQP